jgi:DNA adenine methylase
MSNIVSAKPFVKWVGGKTGLIPTIERLLPGNVNSGQLTYVEPFVGGGGFLFHMLQYHNFKEVIINDLNAPLMDCYACFQNPKLFIELVARVSTLEEQYNRSRDKEKSYYGVRDEYNNILKQNSLMPMPLLAAYFIFLNKTCFNGLYRVNKKGEFNVPWGKKAEIKLYDELVYNATATVLSNVKISTGDYGFIQNLKGNDTLIYLDPPYMPEKEQSFTSYTAGGFDLKEQERLHDICDKLNANEVKWIQSNSNSPIIKDLYKGYNIKEVSAPRSISAKGDGRGQVTELIITNY